MRLQHFLIALSTLLHNSVAAYDESPNIGIHLTSGYATVSARVANNSYIDIAKIEGSEAYKSYMLGSQKTPETATARYCPFPHQICKYWPLHSTQSHHPLAPMLTTLITAAEFTLDTAFSSAAISVHEGSAVTKSFEQDVQSTFNKLGIHHYGLQYVTQHLVQALKIKAQCSSSYARPDDPDFEDQRQLIFTVEYTRHALTALLWEEECGVPAAISRVRSPKLGHDALLACRESAASNDQSCDKALQTALSNVAKAAGKHDQTIDFVLLHGELGQHDDLANPLRQVFSERFVNGDGVDFSHVQKDVSPDPVFAGSRAVALAEAGAREIAREEEGWGREL